MYVFAGGVPINYCFSSFLSTDPVALPKAEGKPGRPFVKTMINEYGSDGSLCPTQYMERTWARDLAELSAQVLTQLEAGLNEARGDLVSQLQELVRAQGMGRDTPPGV